MPTENQSTTYCRSRSNGLHRLGEKKDCIRCNPVTKPATKEPAKQGVSPAR